MQRLMSGALALMMAGSLSPMAVYAATSSKSTSVKTLTEKSGSLNEVYMGANGKMVVQGSPKDKDDGLYYMSGSSVKDLESKDTLGQVKYFVDRKYVVTDDDNEIDVTTGKVNSDYDLDLENLLYKKTKDSDVYDFDSRSDVKFDTLERIKDTSTWFYQTQDRWGVIDEKGNYADISRYCNLQLKPENKDSTVSIKEFEKTYDDVTAKLEEVTPIAQDTSYLYFKCKIKVTSDSKDTDYMAIMKTSRKTKTDDDTHFVSSVSTYLVDESDKNFLDAKEFTARNGKLYAIFDDSDKITVKTLEVKRKKVDSKSIPYMAVDNTESQDGSVYTTDSFGNVWVLDSGKIYGFDGDDFKQYYKCDSSADNLIVYDSKNVITWESGEDVYYLATGTSSTSDSKDSSDSKDDKDNSKSDSNKETTEAKDGTYTKGLNKLSNGSQVYSDDGKTLIKNDWKQVDGKWYYFTADGTMATGWVRDLKYNVYHLDEATGVMTTGWYKDGRTNEWYYLGTDGAMKTGWQKVGSTWYYMFNTGMMAQGWIQDKGKWYYLGADGAMRSNCYIGSYKLGADGAWVH